jgi:hypothetical protein
VKPPSWNRVLATGMRFAPSPRRQLTRVLVDPGRRASHQIGMMFGGLVGITRQRAEQLRKVVRAGTDRQLAGLGLVTKTDLVTFERRLRLPAKTPPARKPAVKQNTAPKSATASTTRRAR